MSSAHALSAPPTLSSLPDDILLRIISLSGTAGIQVGTAYRLGAVSTRFRRLLTNNFLTSITNLSHDCLTSLSLSNSARATAALTAMFAHTRAVKELNLGGCPPTLLSRHSIASFARAAADSLVTVNLAYCRVTDDVVMPLLQCPNLTSLSLYSCNSLSGYMFQRGEIRAPLRFLDLSWACGLTRESVIAIAKIPTLKELVLAGIENANIITLPAFAAADVRQSLTSLDLSYCPLRDAALFELLPGMPSLRKLKVAEGYGNLWASASFTTAGIERLRQMYPHVQIVHTF